MPPTRTRQVRRYFHPLLNRSTFSPEFLAKYPVLITRNIFPLAEANPSLKRQPQDEVPICKPKGEVGCVGRGGYSLKSTLGWPDEVYSDVQVWSFNSMCIM